MSIIDMDKLQLAHQEGVRELEEYELNNKGRKISYGQRETLAKHYMRIGCATNAAIYRIFGIPTHRKENIEKWLSEQ